MVVSDEIIPEGFYKDADGSFKRKECSCGKTNKEIEACEQCHPKSYFGMTGWRCPVCGRGNSPFSSSCPCVPFPQWPVTVGPTSVPLNAPLDNNTIPLNGPLVHPGTNINNQTISGDGQ